MKTFFIIPLILIIFLIPLKAQDNLRQFGKISQQEADMTACAEDPSAEAVVLFDLGTSWFSRKENSFDLIFERTTRIKIFNDAGLKWAEIEIPLYQEGGIYEKTFDIEACAYNYENGKLTKSVFNPKDYHDEKIDDKWIVRKFAIPGARAGSIIEYKYKISSQYLFNLRDWYFQWQIPVEYSEYVVKMIPFYEYTFLLQGANKFDSQESYEEGGILRQFGAYKYHDMVHKYIMKKISAFRDEKFLSSYNDYVMKLDFQLAKVHGYYGGITDIITTWPKMIEDLLRDSDFGKYLKKSENSANELISLSGLSKKEPIDRFNAVLDYVKANFDWNGNYRKYASKSIKDFIKDKYGNSADINLFTIGLLNAAKIEAYPVLISTRGHGTIKVDYPFHHLFNYVIIAANIDGHFILSDATEVLCANNRIPPRCINDMGLLIKKDQVTWLGLQSMIPSVTRTGISIAINDSSSFADFLCKSREYDAWHNRKSQGEDKKKIADNLSEKGYNFNDATIEVKNQQEIEKPYLLKYRVQDVTERINGKYYVTPFLNEIIHDNPLKQKVRLHPVDLTYPVQRCIFLRFRTLSPAESGHPVLLKTDTQSR
jgi:hypothetical protein